MSEKPEISPELTTFRHSLPTGDFRQSEALRIAERIQELALYQENIGKDGLTEEKVEEVKASVQEIEDCALYIDRMYATWERQGLLCPNLEERHATGRKIEKLLLNSTGTTMATLGSKGNAHIYDSLIPQGSHYDQEVQFRKKSRLPFIGGAIDPAGASLLCYDEANTVTMIRGRAGEDGRELLVKGAFEEDSFTLPSQIRSGSFLPGGVKAAFACANGHIYTVRLFDKSITNDYTLPHPLRMATWSANGYEMLGVSKEGKEYVTRFSPEGFESEEISAGNPYFPVALALNEDYCVTVSTTSTLALTQKRSPHTRKLFKIPIARAIGSVQLSPDSTHLLIKSRDVSRVSIVNLTQKDEEDHFLVQSTLVTPDKQRSIVEAHFLPSGGGIVLATNAADSRQEGVLSVIPGKKSVNTY